jgi:hypothetical protein
MAGTMKLLLGGDIHIGRASTRVIGPEAPDGLRAAVAPWRLRATAAWERMVDLAVAEGVAAVGLAGDVVDEDNRYWEAIGPLEAGISRLAEHGILTVAVAGNHDHDVLARLADQLPPERFVLLGRGGRWERHTLARDGQKLHIDGWSFPRRQVTSDPLADYDLPADPAAPILGMVHGDLDASTSPYAPLSLARLRSTRARGWLVGHLHAPRLLDQKVGPADEPWILYPGSPQALDPGEPGAHGAWLCEVDRRDVKRPQLRAISTVRYERCEVDLTGADDDQAVQDLILQAVRAAGDRIVAEDAPDVSAIRLRLGLTGRSAASQRVGAIAEGLADDLDLRFGEARLGVERVESRTLPAIDLAEHAASASAPGALARLLLWIEGAGEPPPGAEDLLRRTTEMIEQVAARGELAGLWASSTQARPTVDEDAARDRLVERARALLGELVEAEP